MQHHDSEPAGLPRRELLQTAVAAAAGVSLSACGATPPHNEAVQWQAPTRYQSLVAPRSLVLFQGDSITDAGRDRDHAAEPNSLLGMGTGYAWLAGCGLLASRPEDALMVYNRGISGNKVFQLAERWEVDCLALKPDVVSILIGVNDIWHARGGNYDGTVEIYEADFSELLTRTRTALPAVKLIVCEPFVLRCGAIDDSWFPEFDEYRAAAHRVAKAHAATWVAFQSMFDEAVRYAPPEQWAKDGVHPTPAGAALMAQAWRTVVG